jgi:GNAT superfamily N-acetyltransferase
MSEIRTEYRLQVRQPRIVEWRQVKAMRLAMLQDTPSAYAVTLADALTLPDSHWRKRAQPNLDGTSLPLIAVDLGSGRWVGTAAAVLHAGRELPDLVGVYVDPTWRGSERGVLGALLKPLEVWAKAHGGMRLLVQEGNLRAQRAYAKQGYQLTDYSEAHLLPPYGLDLEMVKRF